MLVELRGKFYRVSFAHDNPQTQVVNVESGDGDLLKVVVHPKRRSTTFCFITEFDHLPALREDSPKFVDGKVECSLNTIAGQAECSKHDVFNKAKGRKLALIAAIKESDFNREERGEIWDAYLATGAKLS